MQSVVRAMNALGAHDDWAAVTANGIMSGAHRTGANVRNANAAWRYMDW